MSQSARETERYPTLGTPLRRWSVSTCLVRLLRSILSMRPNPPNRLTPTSKAAALAVAALALAALAGCATGGSSGSGTAGSGAATSGGPSTTGFDGALLPGNLRPYEFTLTDQDGRRVSLRALRGRVVVLAFLYTASKTTAPLIAQQIRGALDELEGHTAGVTALAVSVDPAADTPARVRAFLRASSLTGRLAYLTGTLAQLRPVWRGYHVGAGRGRHARLRSGRVRGGARPGRRRARGVPARRTHSRSARSRRAQAGGRRALARAPAPGAPHERRCGRRPPSRSDLEPLISYPPGRYSR